MKKRNKGKKALTAVGTVITAGLMPGFIAATPGCLPIQGSNAGGFRPNELSNGNETKVEECIIYSCVEQMPQFPGGEAALMKYLMSHINYPPMAAENEIQGRVVVRFIVSETGKVSDVTVIQSMDKDLDREVVRVCKSLPKFTPGRHNGQAVSVWYTLPVIFKLKDSAADVVTIDGKTYSFDELYAMQHPDSVNLDGSLPEVIVQAYARATKYGIWMRSDSEPKNFEILEGDTVYHRVEQMPKFPRGEAALKEYIESNIQYPAKALKNHVQGCVVVKFVVEKTGKIGATRVVQSVDKELDKEAVRLVKTMPFIPGRKNGKAVSVWYTLQVLFTLPKENND
jgi:TonB family protein